MDISVIIATRNRCDKLPATLGRLMSSIVRDGLQWEVVVVDNGSNDDTAKVCRDFVVRGAGRLLYLYEGKKGKSVALNTGLAAARGRILAFTDDDCIVHPRWLQSIVEAYEADQDLAVLGGNVKLHDNRDASLSLVQVGKATPLTSPRMLYPDPPIIGANMAFKKNVFSTVGTFDVRLGPGTDAISEDIDMVYRAFKGGFKVVTLPTVIVYHDHGRRTDMTRKEIKNLLHRYLVGRGAFYFKHVLKGDTAIARMAAEEVLAVCSRICRLRGLGVELRFLHALAAGALTRFGRRDRT
jgi:glycosyltransferase involved in cell wall biosynthesis